MTIPVPLRFERLTKKGDHKDLWLRLGSYRHACDSYYLAIDESPTASRHLGASLARLLEQWKNQVDELKGTGGTAYLPYDFSDQCTAWLRVTSTDGSTAEVHAGWSLVEAWGIEPSNYAATAPEIKDFDPIANARIECSLEDLSQCIAMNAKAHAASRHY
ncbi:hypothetical protein M5362_24510 [Streptomyces sp. Je 1-79]|uniref:hypothetical protein n=1 Tax=Streptomyces sp. Je 1-79 TaxID=2943847 RepID=UPI0021A30AAB|nr:hypothetical protein [Streptomyces sp. Je 1-79]MCT4356294.1 hypothetical protein [Streptomyces sp. Je 1-79]